MSQQNPVTFTIYNVPVETDDEKRRAAAAEEAKTRVDSLMEDRRLADIQREAIRAEVEASAPKIGVLQPLSEVARGARRRRERAPATGRPPRVPVSVHALAGLLSTPLCSPPRRRVR